MAVLEGELDLYLAPWLDSLSSHRVLVTQRDLEHALARIFIGRRASLRSYH